MDTVFENTRSTRSICEPQPRRGVGGVLDCGAYRTHPPTAMTRAAAIFASVAIAGCCTMPWRAHRIAEPPDEACETGHAEAGDDVFVWYCLRGARVVVHQYRGTFACSAAVRETAPCGQLTPYEREALRPDTPSPEREQSPVCRGQKNGTTVRWNES